MVASSVNAVGVVASCLLSFGLGYVYNSWQQQQSTRAKDEFQSKPADNSKLVEDKDVRENKRKYKRQKLVLCVRMDLKMGRGKAAAQCCHATLAVYKEALKLYPERVKMWEEYGAAKVVVKVPDEGTLHDLQKAAQSAGVPNCIIMDAGRTQIAAGSETVLAVGPAPVEEVDAITSHLKLL